MPPPRSDSAPLVALTGATGFVGRHLVPALAARGMRLRLLTRRDPVCEEWRDIDLEVVPGSLSDGAALRHLVAGADRVVHLAGLIKAISTQQFLAVNREGTRALAQAVRRHAPAAGFLQLSTLAAREPSLSGYASSKQAGEKMAFEALGSQVSVLRPPAVYGPGDRETLIFFQIAARRRVWVPGSAAARMALIHASDLAQAIAEMVESAPTGRIHYVSDARPEGYGWREILGAAARATGNENPDFRSLPRWGLAAAAMLGDAGRGFGAANMLTSEKLRELLHDDWALSAEERATAPKFSCKYSLQAGFGTAVAWYRRVGWLKSAAGA